MTQKELKTIRIKKEIYDKIKNYCNDRNLKIYKWVQMILEKEVSNGK